MKIGLECAFCIVHRAWRESVRATRDPELRFRALKAVIDMLSREFTPEVTPAYLGTLRDRIVSYIISMIKQPYKKPHGGLQPFEVKFFSFKVIEERQHNRTKIADASYHSIVYTSFRAEHLAAVMSDYPTVDRFPRRPAIYHFL